MDFSYRSLYLAVKKSSDISEKNVTGTFLKRSVLDLKNTDLKNPKNQNNFMIFFRKNELIWNIRIVSRNNTGTYLQIILTKFSDIFHEDNIDPDSIVKLYKENF